MQSLLASTVIKQRDKILFLALQLFWALDRIVARLSPTRTRRLAWFTVAGTAGAGLTLDRAILLRNFNDFVGRFGRNHFLFVYGEPLFNAGIRLVSLQSFHNFLRRWQRGHDGGLATFQ